MKENREKSVLWYEDCLGLALVLSGCLSPGDLARHGRKSGLWPDGAPSDLARLVRDVQEGCGADPGLRKNIAKRISRRDPDPPDPGQGLRRGGYRRPGVRGPAAPVSALGLPDRPPGRGARARARAGPQPDQDRLGRSFRGPGRAAPARGPWTNSAGGTRTCPGEFGPENQAGPGPGEAEKPKGSSTLRPQDRFFSSVGQPGTAAGDKKPPP